MKINNEIKDWLKAFAFAFLFAFLVIIQMYFL